jgi:hypothetical protein
VARRYRVSVAKVRGWISRGELSAINVAAVLCGPARLVVTPEALADFERLRQVGPAPKPMRRQKRPWKDYYPD